MKLAMRIISFCHYLQGPAATQYLADMGADVIKIEPLAGAFERRWSGGNSYAGGVSAFLLSANRNKRSLAIDLKSPKSRDIMLKLIDGADAIVENFRPGVLDRLGYGYEAIKARKPDIIYASATGLGADGPDAGRPGQDLLMQARSGLVAATGSSEAGPTIVGAAIADQHGASLLAMGILAAFVRKLQTGEGTRVEASLFQAAIDLQSEALTMYFMRQVQGDVMRRGPNIGSWYHDAPYGAYKLVDCHIVLSMNDPVKLAAALESDELQALAGIDRYAERERYAAAMAKTLAGHTFANLAARFDAHGIWFERVQSYDELAEDRQAAHMGAFREYEVDGRKIRLIAHPLRYDGALPGIDTMPLSPGCDSRAILSEIGLSESEIDRLAEDGVIASPVPAAA
ncbi:CaiB/BaiF CoA-transferase family protein [Aquamicrobium sp. LC103]|uniref:CaiB/BaiF CoA transferase family protein n=1 Tax=Aquamicrobium sp. LC103 TaxID=1120658 RepID=UPI00063E91AF|nr:CaiB/BaiF CoA-transferase family protein [Aquamicrobium sp. LC103]TKT74408.1 CoA transferase [Aquamicrobium sp. LC103]